MTDPKEAAKAADWIEKEYAGKPTESAKMLRRYPSRPTRPMARTAGSVPAESRYTWECD